MTFQPIIMIGFSTKNFGFFGSDQLFLKDFLTRIFSLFSLREIWPKPKMIFFIELMRGRYIVNRPYKKKLLTNSIVENTAEKKNLIISHVLTKIADSHGRMTFYTCVV